MSRWAKPIPVTIGGMTYASKTRAKERAREILRQVPRNAPMEGAADAFFRALVALHPAAAEKIGVGIAHFSLERGGFGSTEDCVWITRLDGSRIDFSWRLCIEARSRTMREEMLMAARREVYPDVFTFKQDAFARPPAVCAISGKPLTWDEAHAHHAGKSFDQIFAEFLGARCPQLTVASDGIARTFADRCLAAEWRDYHLRHAVLQLVDGATHRQLAHCRPGIPQKQAQTPF